MGNWGLTDAHDGAICLNTVSILDLNMILLGESVDNLGRRRRDHVSDLISDTRE